MTAEIRCRPKRRRFNADGTKAHSGVGRKPRPNRRRKRGLRERPYV